ncbi:MAG: sugar ABC transporter permease [Treponema sp.]|jgi:multiple sugar transport system permease protein/raffinose/stachyose/melibiose transport system permease protein|nr:sugar ABC transporter permease [Treponema sp.]
MKNTKFVIAVLTPVFLCMFTFQILPIFLGFGISFFNYSPLNAGNEFIGLSNFAKLVSDPVFHIALKNTLYFVLAAVSINIMLTLTIAQIISSFRYNKIRSIFRVIFFMPCVAPLAASSFVWARMYEKRFGFINIMLDRWFGVAPRAWLGEAATMMPSIILFTLWADIGYNIIIFCAGIEGIPPDFHEAAVIDGAGPLRRFFKITLPLLGRTTCFVVAMTLISHFQMFAQFEVMLPGHGGPNNMGMVLTLDIYKTAFVYKDLGYASAISIVLFIVIMIFTMVSQRLNRVDWGY